MNTETSPITFQRIDADATPEGFPVIHVYDDDAPYTLGEAETEVRFGSDIPHDDGLTLAEFALQYDPTTEYLRDAKGRVYGKRVGGQP